MVGIFDNYAHASEFLRKSGYSFAKILNGMSIFVIRKSKDFAEIHEYTDGSASILYGTYSVNL